MENKFDIKRSTMQTSVMFEMDYYIWTAYLSLN